jgi:ATP-binding cassette subfamily G (WHITE) protein 2
MTLIAYSGYILEISSITEFLQWIKWISIFRYAANILSINEFTNLTLCLTNNTSICSIKGEDILNDQNIDYLTSWDLWKNFVALSTMTLIFFVLSYIQLLRIKKMK